MQIQYNRKLAAVVLVVCVLVGILGFGGLGLTSERNKALRVFDEGVDTSFATRFSVDAYLENCAGYAGVMAEEYRMRVDSEDEKAEEVLQLASQIGDGEDLGLRNAVFKDLTRNVEALYSDFHAAVTDEAAQDDFDRAYSNYQSEVKKVGYDEYNAMSRSYNKLRSAIPARWIAGLWGLDGLETFGG